MMRATFKMVFRSSLLIALVSGSFLAARGEIPGGVIINRIFDDFLDFIRPIAIARGGFTVLFDDWKPSIVIRHFPHDTGISAPILKALAALKGKKTTRVDFNCTDGQLGNLTTVVRKGDVIMGKPEGIDEINILAQTSLEDLHINYKCDVYVNRKVYKKDLPVGLKFSNNTFEQEIVLEGVKTECTVRVPVGSCTELGDVEVVTADFFVDQVLEQIIDNKNIQFQLEMGKKYLDSVRALLSTNELCDFLKPKHKNASKKARKHAHHR